MATHWSSMAARQIDGAVTLNTHPESTDMVARDQVALLAQATKVRDEALRLLHERFSKDLKDVIQLVGCSAPDAFTLQVEYASELTANYLAESERMFDLMSKLARDGLLETRQNR